MKVSTIITAVRTVLLDNFSYGDSSYSDPELIGFYNRACNFCVDLSSTCNPVTKVVSLVAVSTASCTTTLLLLLRPAL